MNDLYAKRMDHFFMSICFFAILLAIHIYYGFQQSEMNNTFMPLSSALLILWAMIGVVIFQYSSMPQFLLLMVLISSVLAFYQDWTTQYFSKRWLLLFLIVILCIPYCPVENRSRLIACAYAAIMGIAVYFHWLGLADWIYMIVVGGVLGFWRLLLLLITSSIIGLLDALCVHKTYIPFISALVINSVWIITLTF